MTLGMWVTERFFSKQSRHLCGVKNKETFWGWGGEGRGEGQGGEMAQTVYAHMNKWIKKKIVYS
jgi:hypothetical protein